jgi:nitrate/nitrite transport system substrate-binding protein
MPLSETAQARGIGAAFVVSGADRATGTGNPARRTMETMTKTTTQGSRRISRRTLLKAGAGSAALLASLRVNFPGGAFAQAAGPEVKGAKLGFIALTDAAPLFVAKEKGIFAKYGMPDVEVQKQASWGTTRDNLVLGSEGNGIDGAHILTPMPYLISSGKVTQNNVPTPMYILARLNLNGQCISVGKEYSDLKVGVDTAPFKAALEKKKAAGKSVKAAMTFPGGTHDLWIRYWLAAGGIDPDKDIETIVVPPPQMVANMKVGTMDCFCVCEPWGARAIADNIGFTAETTQAIWKDHPEKVLGTTAEFVQKYPNTARALTAAVLEASKFIDASASNRRKTAETIAAKSYVNTDMDIILDRMLGRYSNGLGKTWDDPDPMRFYHDGAVNFPYLSDGMWFLTQHKRWGLLKAHPDYLAVAKQINRIDIYKQAAAATGTPLPKSDMRTAKLIDGVVWDAKNPAAYADGFKLKA